jgi:hypothetical protein
VAKFKSYREESREDYGTTSDSLDREQISLGALLRIADSIEDSYDWANRINLCSIIKSIPKIASALNKPLTVRVRHVFRIEIKWSIRWPWYERAKKRQRTLSAGRR